MSEDVSQPWRAVALTLFPEMFPGSLGQSLAGRALEDKRWSLETVDIREYATDKHRTVDDTPTGGGAGMVMRPDIVDLAVRDVQASKGGDLPLIYMTPRGRPLTQDRVRELAQGPGVAVLCGRYEGVDQRVLDAHDAEEISVGDFVLSGGEVAALVLMDACVRLIPGVMGSDSSHEEESFEEGLLEYPLLRGPLNGMAARCRTFCCLVTTQRYALGGANRLKPSPGKDARTCGKPLKINGPLRTMRIEF